MSLGRLGIVLAVVLAGAASAAGAGTAAPPQLGDVFGRVAAARAAGRPALAVFGLDGTLLDPAARTREIFTLAFDGPDPVVNPPRPDLAAAARTLPLGEYADEPETTLARLGVTDTAFVRAVRTRWTQDFFANRFLTRDTAVPGAVAYVDSLYARGCTIVYLSGRDAPRMLAGTAQSLIERGFPVGIARTMIVLKPSRAASDSGDLRRAIEDLAACGTVVALFESDPRRLDLLRQRFPEALAFQLARSSAPGTIAVPDYTGFRVP